MAQQRWSEPGGERARGARRRRGLGALVAGLTMLGACSGDPVAPPPSPPLGGGTAPSTPGGTNGPRNIGMASIIGTWRNVNPAVRQTTNDVQRITTTWHFGAAGDCSRTVETVFQFDSIPSTSIRTCRWVFDGSNNLGVTFNGDVQGREIQIHLFVDVSSSNLVLDDLVFVRVG